MEKNIKLPKHLDYKKVQIYGTPYASEWEERSGTNYLYLCRARDTDDVDGGSSYWKTGLFTGGNVELGTIHYRMFPINNVNGKGEYNDDFSVGYDELQLIRLPCVFFTRDDVLDTGTVIGFYDDGSCAVLTGGVSSVIKIEASKIRYISDILEMEG